MKSLRLIIPDLFLPKDFAAEVSVDLRLPALTKLLARGSTTPGKILGNLENLLGELFCQSGANDAPIAAISAVYDGLPQGNWLRADPVNLRLQRDQLLLSSVLPSVDEAQQFCSSLNEYFAGQGMAFFAPHPQRWYVRLDEPPNIRTTPLPELFGCNVRRDLPTGEDAAHWHKLFNEIQMLLYAHSVNDAREVRGEPTINSVWLWGEGKMEEPLRKDYQSVSSDDELVKMFSSAADIPFLAWDKQWNDSPTLTLPQGERGYFEGNQLLVWTGLRAAIQQGDLAAWRDALQAFEIGYVQPLWQAMQSGKISQIKIDVLAGDNSRSFNVMRSAAWNVWRRSKPLAQFSLV
ncbi:MAG: hypothetical protein HOO97_11170 [Sideroxydans sp.]|nr:hypothetical protein [Sideroxydans sp.]